MIESKKPFRLTGRIKSVRFSLFGFLTMLKSQHNAWIHAAATIAACSLGFLVGLDRMEWCWVVLAIMVVWTAEALNTAFEFLAEVASPEFHPLVEKAKDVAAAAVLISASGSAVIGVLVIGPKLLEFIM